MILIAALAISPFGPGASAAETANILDIGHGAATILAAGDIGDCKDTLQRRLATWWNGKNPYVGAHKTARLLEQHRGMVLLLGDLVYPQGGELNVHKCFEASWGRFKDRIASVPGNHDFDTTANGVSGWGYFDYWGAKAGGRGRGYYSFDRGAWHLIALNSELPPPGLRTQEAWLRSDLSATNKNCILAFSHRPAISSGQHGNSERMASFFRVLYEAGASILLSGHDHDYERFAPLAPGGAVDPRRGIRVFVVGTGGGKLRKKRHTQPGSEAFNKTSWGVLKLTLLSRSYTWRFVPVDAEGFTDSGKGNCVTRGRSLPGADRAETEAGRVLIGAR